MTEYLKKAEVLDYLIKCAEGAQADFDENGGESGIYVECLEDVIQDITSMPAAGGEEVTQCKNCCYSEQIAEVFYCSYWSKNTEENGYCHKGG